MRDLRVLGLEPDGKFVVCADTVSGEKFRLPADDKLRAASRGDLARLGQIEIEMDSVLRPKEIQARIRGGASVEQVAKESGMAVSRVEVFAHPVLLERSQAANMAQLGHPMRPDGPSVQTLADIVALAFRGRGHNLDDASWDAWRDEDRRWVAQLEWKAGRTTNKAHFHFAPDSHGGTITPLDDTASELIDPDFGRQLRGLAPVHTMTPAVVVEPAPTQSFDDYYGAETDADKTAREESPPKADAPEPPAPAAAAPAAPTGSKNKRGKPSMPSWEDVLLGVRSNGHN